MILLPTTEPERLLHRIRSAIDNKIIRTWSYDPDGDFTHTAAQWTGQAWLRPAVGVNDLRFHIVPPRNTHVSSAVYAVYHGRFIETILRHFDTALSGLAAASALPEEQDEVQ